MMLKQRCSLPLKLRRIKKGHLVLKLTLKAVQRFVVANEVAERLRYSARLDLLDLVLLGNLVLTQVDVNIERFNLFN
jgi:hypothetical protein